MKETLARHEFKKLIGQANHFLVTTLVGLDCLDKNRQHQADGLHAAWSPKSVDISIRRSRLFVLHSFLASAVDALDVYFSLLNRKPDFIQDGQLSGRIQACGRSVYQKAVVLSEWVNLPQPSQTHGVAEIESALVEVLITWRNNVQHELADNVVSSRSEEILKKNSETILTKYCNLDPEDLAQKANSGAGMSFKEVASLINAAHKYVEHIDFKILASLNKRLLMEKSISDDLKSGFGGQGFRVRLFDVKSARWNSFISNWAQTTLKSPPLTSVELIQINQFICEIKSDKN